MSYIRSPPSETISKPLHTALLGTKLSCKSLLYKIYHPSIRLIPTTSRTTKDRAYPNYCLWSYSISGHNLSRLKTHEAKSLKPSVTMSRPGQPGRMVQRGQRDRLGGNSYRC